MAEQLPLKQLVQGSSPWWVTINSKREEYTGAEQYASPSKKGTCTFGLVGDIANARMTLAWLTRSHGLAMVGRTPTTLAAGCLGLGGSCRQYKRRSLDARSFWPRSASPWWVIIKSEFSHAIRQ